jgi:hypothetical protein
VQDVAPRDLVQNSESGLSFLAAQRTRRSAAGARQLQRRVGLRATYRSVSRRQRSKSRVP